MLHDKVGPIRAIHGHASVDQWNCCLTLDREANRPQLILETGEVSALQETRAYGAMNGDSSRENLGGKIIQCFG
jgi:hypothetical protein